jgi:acyl-CoA thioesterase-1
MGKRSRNNSAKPGYSGYSANPEIMDKVGCRAFFWRLTDKVSIKIWPVLLSALIVLCCNSEPTPVQSREAPVNSDQVYDGRIVAVGDSLTAGLGVDEDQAYPAQLARRLMADGFQFDVINAGVSGETSSGTLSRIQWVLSSLKPDILIIETGANDGLRGLDPELLKNNLDQLLALLSASDVQVILAGMLMLPNLGPEYTQAFATIYPQVAEKHQVLFMPFFLEGVAGDADLNQADKLHPTARGYSRIVDNLYPYVLDAIKKYRRKALRIN